MIFLDDRVAAERLIPRMSTFSSITDDATRLLDTDGLGTRVREPVLALGRWVDSLGTGEGLGGPLGGVGDGTAGEGMICGGSTAAGAFSWAAGAAAG